MDNMPGRFVLLVHEVEVGERNFSYKLSGPFHGCYFNSGDAKTQKGAVGVLGPVLARFLKSYWQLRRFDDNQIFDDSKKLDEVFFL